MKRFLSCLILCGLVCAVGCSGDSQKAPKPPTTPSDAWQITSLAASNDNPFVNTAIVVAATVTVNGEAAPDGTNVEFLANGGLFPANGGTDITVATTGGTASVQFGALEAGLYQIRARVKSVTAQISIAYRDPDQIVALQIFNLNPASGLYSGGQTVEITGKGIRAPAEVYFENIQGGVAIYPAQVIDVVPSVPVEAQGTITVLTPEPTAADPTQTSQANVRVVVGVGTTEEQTQTLPNAYTYIGTQEPPPDEPPTPVIFGVDPFVGRSAGGEAVTILGTNFEWDNPAKAIEPTFDQVYFLFQGQELLAQVERSSESQIEVITPRFSLTPLTADTNAGVRLTRTGDDPVEKNDIFIVQSDVAQPDITGISPTAGPLDGGTIVTISGGGFELPVQVLFGTLEATDVQVFNDTSIADNDVITCRTPDYSQSGQVPPFSVNVQVTNLQNGLSDTSAQTFTFGDTLYITQANPTEGRIGDLLTLFGAGFEDPLTVFFRAGGEVEFDVISVTGTQLTLRSPSDLAPTCNDRSGDFRLVLNETGQEATGGTYTLLGSNPTITSVEPIFVQETDFGNGVVPAEIDINGVRFADNLLVLIDNFTIDPGFVTVESPELVHVSQIPAPNDFGLTFNTTSCTTQSGLQGVRQVATPVDVTVRNLPVGCDDTLRQTLVYLPEDESCQVAPVMGVTVPSAADFGDIPAGACSLPQPLLITNNGSGTLEIQTLFLQGRFFFQAGFDQDAGPLTVAPFAFDDSLNLYFCPDEPTGGSYNGQLVITSNNPGSPNNYPLTGNEATPPEIATAPYGDGDTWTFQATANPACWLDPTPLTISNTGVSDLALQSVVSSDPTQFQIVVAPPATLGPGQDFDLQLQFCPDDSGAGARTATLTIDHDAVQVDPIVIDLAGTAN